MKTIKAIWRAFKRFSNIWSERHLGVYSSQAAFYMFISLFPFCALLFGIIKAFPEGNASLASKAMDMLPALLGNVLTEAYNAAGEYSAAAIIPITVLFTLWTASKGMYALSNGLNSAYGSDGAGGIKRRAVSILYTLIFISVIILSLFLLVFGNTLHRFFTKLLPGLVKFSLLIKATRAIVLLAIITAFFILIYKFLAGKKHRLRDTLPGAVLSGLGWIILSYGYSLYIDYYVSAGNSLYGSLTAVVLLMFWLEACMSVTLAGGLLNSYVARSNADRLP
ncbi:MAG: YihY/virulence factor BrkB family protein [Eubacteriales bacterium]|nr:YihY/virulence factor BrkB family protein [Eubacteriales bacterium]